MAKLQIPLNGSNIVNKDRQKAFTDSLADDHHIDCGDNGRITVSSEDMPHRDESPSPAVEQPSMNQGQDSQLRSAEISLSQALEHTYQHQERTMEIHQQYLAQQTEYIQLITSVLDQQGKVLDQGSGNGAAQMVETFQRTLDNFHAIREQGIRVHQEFLHQQSAFSERYLQVLEGSQLPRSQAVTERPVESPSKQVTEWVVQQPPIIVDAYSPAESQPVQEQPEPETGTPGIEVPAAPRTSTVNSKELANALLDIVAEKTGYPVEMLEMDMDLEADLGIDSIKRVEILGTLEEKYPSLPPANTETLGQTRTLKEILAYLDSETAALDVSPKSEPAHPEEEKPSIPAVALQKDAEVKDSSSISPDYLKQVLLEIVAEKTGYPAEMLEMDMDMEADLGIDSIKRVEILGTMEEQVPELPSIEAETLAGLRTLGQIVDLMGNGASTAVISLPAEGEDKKKAEHIDLEKTPISLQSLPEPDRLEFVPNAERPLILSYEGTDFTGEAAALLSAEGWKVVIWAFPEGLLPEDGAGLPEGIPVVRQTENGKGGIDKALNEIRTAYGIPSGFIHLHHSRSEGKGLFDSLEEQIIKQVFLISGAIKGDLDQKSSPGWNLFLIVLRGDGSLGLEGGGEFQEGSGLAGLAKTLRWEWPDVFCRYIDLSRALENGPAALSLAKEIHDPDRGLVEVGLRPDSRQTIQRNY